MKQAALDLRKIDRTEAVRMTEGIPKEWEVKSEDGNRDMVLFSPEKRGIQLFFDPLDCGRLRDDVPWRCRMLSRGEPRVRWVAASGEGDSSPDGLTPANSLRNWQ